MTQDAEHLSVRLSRDMDGLRVLADWVDTVSDTLALSTAVSFSLRLCLEEVVVNLVLHGVPAFGHIGRDEFVSIDLQATHDELRLVVTDTCVPFDPRVVAAPSQPKDLETAGVGGLGIHLLRIRSRNLDYETDGTANRLMLTIPR